MPRQQLSPGPSAKRWGWLLAALTLAIAGGTAYEFAIDARWVGMALFGVVLPLTALADWYIVRRRSGDARFAADRGLLAFLITLLAVGMLVRSEQECEPEPELQPAAPAVTY